MRASFGTGTVAGFAGVMMALIPGAATATPEENVARVPIVVELVWDDGTHLRDTTATSGPDALTANATFFARFRLPEPMVCAAETEYLILIEVVGTPRPWEGVGIHPGAVPFTVPAGAYPKGWPPDREREESDPQWFNLAWDPVAVPAMPDGVAYSIVVTGLIAVGPEGCAPMPLGPIAADDIGRGITITVERPNDWSSDRPSSAAIPGVTASAAAAVFLGAAVVARPRP